MKICDCYRVETEQYRSMDENGVSGCGHIKVPCCWGTKERDACSCGGDGTKCDFYESVRAGATDILKNDAETREYLESLPKIYMIAKWAGCGVREFPFVGKCDDKGIPFVYCYDDCNGTCDRYFLRKLTDTTTGWIYAWTTSECRAREIARVLNEAAGESWRND